MESSLLVRPKGVIRHAWSEVSVEGHVEDVRDKLVELIGRSTIQFSP